MAGNELFEVWLDGFRRRIRSLEAGLERLNQQATTDSEIARRISFRESALLETLDRHQDIWSDACNILASIANRYADVAFTITPNALNRRSGLRALVQRLSIDTAAFAVTPGGDPAFLSRGSVSPTDSWARRYLDQLGVAVPLAIRALNLAKFGSLYWTMSFGAAGQSYRPFLTQRPRLHSDLPARIVRGIQEAVRPQLEQALSTLPPLGGQASDVLDTYQPLGCRIEGNLTFFSRLRAPVGPKPAFMTPLDNFAELPPGVDVRMSVRSEALAQILMNKLAPYADEQIRKFSPNYRRTDTSWMITTGAQASDAAGAILIIFVYYVWGDNSHGQIPIFVDAAMPVSQGSWILRISLVNYLRQPWTFVKFLESPLLSGVADGRRSVDRNAISIQTSMLSREDAQRLEAASRNNGEINVADCEATWEQILAAWQDGSMQLDMLSSELNSRVSRRENK